VGNHTDAEDITLETFVTALDSLHRYRGDGRPDACLLVIARQQISLAARRSRPTRRNEVLQCDLSADEREALHLSLAADRRQLRTTAS
jgi:DNA-directed RNA polymerase specialized sigma24 family protein